MAYEKTASNKVLGDSLDSLVGNLTAGLQTQITARNAEDEANFNATVLSQNLPLEDQLSYRQQQLTRVTDDKAETARIKAEIAGLKDRIVQKQFSDDYQQKLTDLASGSSSIDSVISWLTDQKSTATDQGVIDNINKELESAQQKKYDLTTQIIQNQTQYAVNDKSDAILTSQISKVTSAKNAAMLNGDNALASSLDLQLQSLNKAQTENSIQADISKMAVATVTGYSNAEHLLDSYNSKISSADSTSPITIGGITYPSAKDFWTNRRDSYVADSSSAGFFGRINDEVNTDIKTLASKNSLDQNSLLGETAVYNSLAARPELAGYENKIQQTKQDSLQTGGDLISNTIANKYSTDYDVNAATASLNNLKALGVNVDDAMTKIIVANAGIKTGQINNILSAAQNAMANDPSLKIEDAIQMAIKGGASNVQSPNQLATGTEGGIATEIAKQGQEGTAPNADTRTTIAAPAPGTNPDGTPAAPVVPAPGGAPTTAPTTSGFKTITVKAGDTLSQIAEREGLGASQAQAIATANGISDPNKISIGQVIKIPTGSPVTAPTATPTAIPATTQNPTPAAPVAPKATSTPTSTNPTPAPAPASAPAPVVAPTPTAPTVTTPPKAPTTGYQGVSIVDYLGSVGQDSSYTARQKLAVSKGITNYTGSADQNTQLLKTLRGF